MRRWFVPGLLLIAGLFFLGSQAAHAHGFLLRSIPQDRSVEARSPSRVQLWFSEGLEPRFSSLTVSNQAGQRVDLGDGGVAPGNRSQLSARLPPNLPDGAYIATMRVAFSSDGHISTDTLVFWVGQQTGSVATSGASQDVPPLEVAARLLVLAGLIVAFGALLLYRLVLYPAWSNPVYRAGGLAPRIMTRLYGIMGLAISAALVGNGLWLIQQSMALFAADLPRVLRESLWIVVVNGTQFGDTWKLRLVLLIMMAGLLYAASRLSVSRPALVYPLWSLASIVAAAALGSLSLSGHAPGATLWPLLSIGVDWLHLLANSAWVGGLLTLIAVLHPAFEPLGGDGQRLALLAALRRFSPLAVVAVALLILSGAYSALLYFYTPDQLATTNYGHTLIAKLILIAPLLLLGLAHHLALAPGRYHAAERWINISLRGEAVFGLSVILIVALLTATPPPSPPNARASAALPILSASQGDLTLTFTPNPGAVGSNSYDVRLMRAGKPLDGAQLSAQFVYPALDRRSAPLAFDGVGNGLYVAAGTELNREGSWQFLFDVRPAANVPPLRMALSWPLPAQAGQGAARVPSLLNWLSLGGLLAVLALWLVPRARRRTQGLSLDPQGVMIGLGALGLTILVLGGGAFYMNSAARAYEEASSPAPTYVNSALPDQAALDAGRTLYQANCAACHESSKIPVSYFTLNGDSEIYRYLLGVTGHPYGRTLSAEERWAVVNLLREHFQLDRQ